MYVEDLLLAINYAITIGTGAPYHARPFGGLLDSEWHRNFISSVSNHVLADHQLSTNQSQTILKLIRKVRSFVVEQGMATDLEIDDMLLHPEHRRPLYESIAVPREVRHLGSNLIGFRFKQNDVIARRIKSFGEPAQTEWLQSEMAYTRLELIARPRFDWSVRIWIVPVFRHNLLDILGLIREYRFGVNAGTAEYLNLAWRSQNKSSAFVLHDDLILANVCDNPLLAAWITEVADGVVL